MKNPDIFAMYLPQYHETELNDRFWGKGFTDWTSVKKATPLFAGHNQPKKPLNGYYDLSRKEDIYGQFSIAKTYGISGFGIYHYWFNSQQQALTTPARIIFDNKDLDLPFFFAWDNASWKRTWSKIQGNDWAPLQDHGTKNDGLLIEYKLGTQEDWKIHYDYLRPFFLDSRYYKINNCPVFVIFRYEKTIERMIDCWNQWAIKDGLNGVRFVFVQFHYHKIPLKYDVFRYEPLYSVFDSTSEKIKRVINPSRLNSLRIFDYDKAWKSIIANSKRCFNSKAHFGGFVNYDDTPRRGTKGKVILGGTPDKFERYLNELVEIAKRKNQPFIFLTAWNEWGEGAYLEPDTINKYDYLNAIYNVTKGKKHV